MNIETVNLTPCWHFIVDTLAEYGALLQRTAPPVNLREDLGEAAETVIPEDDQSDYTTELQPVVN